MYIPLRTASVYSLLESTLTVPKLVQLAKKHGLKAMGVADVGHLFGALEVSLSFQKAGIQPILGCQMSVLYDADAPPATLVLYAKTEKGYQNLCRLVTDSTVGQQHEHRGLLRPEQFSGLTEGLLALTGGARGPLDRLLLEKKPVAPFLTWLQERFPAHLYIEISRQDPAHEPIEHQLIELAYAHDVPLIATHDTRFSEPEDHRAYETLRCIAEGNVLDDPTRTRQSPNLFFASPKTMADRFEDLPEALENTVSFSERVSFVLRAKPAKIPVFTPNAPEALERLAREGLAKRAVSETQKDAYDERLAYECAMISKMGFADYFLIVADFIQWAKAQNIPVGPGRGSGASSLVAWSLGITEVDPIRFALFFERFLNPDRVSPPDFDVDFCQKRRDEVIHYVQQKYGADHVAHIITFGKMQARMVLRDVGRVLGMPYGQIDRISKLVPFQAATPITLEEAFEKEPQFKAEAVEDPQVQTLFDLAQKLEGLYRHVSTHAAGIVISTEPLRDVVPLYQDPDATLPATEFSLKYIDDAGLIKFDFLGLKNLTTVQNTLETLAKKGIVFDINAVPLDDPKTFELLRRAECVGVFQLEGGMSEVLAKLQPEKFEELIALVSLYRPGPISDIPRYIAGRHGHVAVEYAYPCLKPILEETFGVMVYQEQVLQIAKVLAGYTLGQADLLRRAMAKKIPAELEAQRKLFVEGTLAAHGGTEETASTLFDNITRFSGYAFPKAHAAPYALIAYQTAYLKANYPSAYMAALLTIEMAHTEPLENIAREVRRMGIVLFPPDVNTSDVEFTSSEEGIRYGLAAIKNVGLAVVEKLVQARQTGGPFVSTFELLERAPKWNRRVLESLIFAGAFDVLNPNRRQLFEHIDELINSQDEGPPMLFAASALRAPWRDVEPWSALEKLERERSVVGFYLSGHPIARYWSLFKTMGCVPSVGSWTEGQTAWLAGVLLSKLEKMSKKGEKFVLLQLSDGFSAYEATLFGDVLVEARARLQVGKMFVLRVWVGIKESGVRFSANRILELESVLEVSHLSLTVETTNEVQKLQHFLKPGDVRLALACRVQVEDRWVLVGGPVASRVSVPSALALTLVDLLGDRFKVRAKPLPLDESRQKRYPRPLI